jgi:hypothetical protein
MAQKIDHSMQNFYSMARMSLEGERPDDLNKQSQTPPEKRHYNRNSASFVEIPKNNLNIIDYCDWAGIPFKGTQSRKGVEFKIGDAAQVKSDHLQKWSNDLSSISVNLPYSSNGNNRVNRGFYNRLSGKKINKVNPGYNHSSELNRFIIEVNDLDKGHTVKEAVKASNELIAQMAKEYGVETRHQVTDNSFNATFNSQDPANYVPGNSKAKDTNLTNEEELAAAFDPHSTEYKNPGKNHNSKDWDLVQRYLVGERGINEKLAKRLFDKDYIRTGAGSKDGKYDPYIEFVWKRPTNVIHRPGVNMETPGAKMQENTIDVGADRIYFDNPQTLELSHKQGNRGKSIVSSSEPTGFNIPAGSGKKSLYVFEAPIDALSFYTLHSRALTASDATVLSLSGASSKLDHVSDFLERTNNLGGNIGEKNGLRNIYLCFDNDSAGRSAIAQFTEKVLDKRSIEDPTRNNGLVVRAMVPPEGKDWNETLKQYLNTGLPLKRPKEDFTISQFDKMVISETMDKLSPEGQLNMPITMQSYHQMYEQFAQTGHVPGPKSAYTNNLKSDLSQFTKDDREIFDTFMQEFGQDVAPVEVYEQSKNLYEILPGNEVVDKNQAAKDKLIAQEQQQAQKNYQAQAAKQQAAKANYARNEHQAEGFKQHLSQPVPAQDPVEVNKREAYLKEEAKRQAKLNKDFDSFYSGLTEPGKRNFAEIVGLKVENVEKRQIFSETNNIKLNEKKIDDIAGRMNSRDQTIYKIYTQVVEPNLNPVGQQSFLKDYYNKPIMNDTLSKLSSEGKKDFTNWLEYQSNFAMLDERYDKESYRDNVDKINKLEKNMSSQDKEVLKDFEQNTLYKQIGQEDAYRLTKEAMKDPQGFAKAIEDSRANEPKALNHQEIMDNVLSEMSPDGQKSLAKWLDYQNKFESLDMRKDREEYRETAHDMKDVERNLAGDDLKALQNFQKNSLGIDISKEEASKIVNKKTEIRSLNPLSAQDKEFTEDVLNKIDNQNHKIGSPKNQGNRNKVQNVANAVFDEPKGKDVPLEDVKIIQRHRMSKAAIQDVQAPPKPTAVQPNFKPDYGTKEQAAEFFKKASQTIAQAEKKRSKQGPIVAPQHKARHNSLSRGMDL